MHVDEPAAPGRFPQRAIEAIVPLSPAQQGLLFHSVYSSESRSYQARAVYRLQGRLDPAAFRRAWQAALARHEALRAAFPWQQSERPLQAVLRADALELPWSEQDWSDAPAAEQLARLAELLERDHAAGFELRRAPLLRLTLARLGADAWYFVFSHHHLILDGWSCAILLRDVLVAHAAELAGAGEPLELEPAPRYRDFIAWLGRQDTGRARAYWQAQLGRGRAPTPLPSDRSGSTEPTPRSHDEAVLRLSEAQTRELLDAARRRGVTPAVLLQTAWALLLGRCAGTRDVVLGLALAGRPPELPGAQAMVGLLMSSLPLRVQWSAATAAADLLAQVQASGAALREHGWSALADVQRWCECERVFDSLLVYDNFPLQGLTEGAGPLRALPLQAPEQALVDGWSAQRNHYPLTLVGVPGRELQLRLSADRRRFGGERAAALLAGVAQLAAQLGSARRIGELTLAPTAAALPAARRRADAGRLPAGPRGADELPHGLLARIAAHAARQPAAPALLCADEQLAWGELERRTRRIAARLRALGVGPETRVALWLPRGIPWVLAMLGVLRAGGCYLPLDRQAPERRARRCVRDAGARFAIALEAGEAAALRGEDAALRALGWGELEPAAAELDAAELESVAALEPHPLALAYVLYTSGSSGAPKGVAVTHGALADYAASLLERAALPAGSSWAWLSSPAADLGNSSVFGALAAGGALLIAAESESDDADRIGERLQQARCAALKIAPSQLLALLGAARSPARLLPRQLLLLGGEPLTQSCVARVRALAPGCRILNHYGPTETTIGVTTHELTGELEAAAVHPIGVPLAHAEVLVLDAEGQPLPDGLAGELCIGGSSLARGYWGQPALSAARFVPDPRAGRAGERLYRSGDRVCRRAGALHFLGRIDAQLKLHGQRIEPAEIEAALLAQPAVASAAVALQEGPAGARLVAFLVARAGAAADSDALRAALAAELPAHMVPAVWVWLAALPLLPSGKLDRGALPSRAVAPPPAADEAPRSELEQRLARLWQAALGREGIGAHASFFELGGDSILSLQLVARARREGLRFTPKQLFDHPTPARLAAALEREAAAAAAPARVEPGAASEWPLAPVQCWFFEQAIPARQHFNQSLLLELREPLAPDALERALAAVRLRHPALHSRFARGEGGWRQRLAPAGGAPLLRCISLAGARGAERAAQLERECDALQRSLDLATGRVFAALHATGEPGAQPAAQLFLTAHHLVIDAVSWRIVLADLHAALAGEPLALLPASYAHWCERLRGEAAQRRALAQLDYWRNQRRAGSLPLDGGAADASENLYRHARSERVALERDETTALERELGSSLRGTLRDAALYAAARALARWSGSAQLALELEGHGREAFGEPDADLSQAVGWFTARYPLRFACDPAAPPLDAFAGVAAALRAVPDGGVGYGVLRYLTPAGAELAALEYPQVTLNFLGATDRGIDAAWLPEQEPDALREPLASGAERDPDAQRSSWLAIAVQLAGGRLSVRWSYGARLHRESTVRALAQQTLAELRALTHAAQRTPRGELRAWSVADSGLSDAELASLAVDGREVEDVYRCSPLQEGLLVQSLRRRGAYVNQWSAELQGLDVGVLRAAWSELQARHAVLRTALLWEGAQGSALRWPVQLVYRRAELPLRELDWREHDDAEQERLWRAELRSDRERGYALERAPLWRLLLARCGAQRWRLLWSRHHVLLDGWSSSRVVSELVRLYEAGLRGESASLEGVTPYREYIRWVWSQPAQESERYWAGELARWSGATPLPLLEAGSPETAEASGFGEVAAELTESEWSAVQQLASASGVTPNALITAAWGLLLSRASGERQVWFGATDSGRSADLEDSQRMVGLLIQTLPLRVSCPAEARVGAWLAELQSRAVEQRERHALALSRLQQLARRGAEGGELFESLLVYENYPLDESVRSGSAVLGVRSGQSTEPTHYGLTLVVVPAVRARLKLQYAGERYTEAGAGRVLELYRSLLQRLVQQGAAGRLGAIGLVDEPRAAVPLARAVDPGETLVSAFRRSARQHAERTALSCGGKSLSYAELDAGSSAVARGLRRLGVRSESRVGLRLEPSLERVVALLGILKAGGCYVPLEADQPHARQQHAVHDAGAQWVVGGSGAEWGAGVCALELAELEEYGSEWGAEPRGEAPSGEQLAYVIYTSGSSGMPKGVGVTHRQVLRLFEASAVHFGFGPGDVWSQFHSSAFDFSVWELWGALLHGGRAVEVPRSVRRDAGAFLELLRTEGVTVLNQTPSAFCALSEPWLAAMAHRRPAALRLVIFGGEALERSRLAAWFTAHGMRGPRLVNMYGITETTVHVTVSNVESAASSGAGSEIGEPLADLQVHVLDASGNACTEGVWGELVVGGAGVGRGYLGRAALTAERFVPDRWGPAGSRVYRSGDRGRRLPGGALEYGGRLDRQVKLRGYRIELGEIESALRECAGVRAALVRLRRARAESGSGEGRLVAYVVAADASAAPSAQALREQLRLRLPEYMLPSAYASVASLPLTANGKLDERALEALPWDSEPGGEAPVAPRDELERRLLQLWAAVLEVEHVGIRDDFFALGGHSLAALRLLSHCRRELGCALELGELFELRTVERLAARLRGASAGAGAGGSDAAAAQAVALLDAFEAEEAE